MAYIGLAKPTIAELDTTTGEYKNAFRCGKAIETSITPQYAEGSLYGDNTKAEYDKEFKYADISLNTTTLPVQAHNIMFGHTVDEEQKKIAYNVADESGYVGYGFYVTEKVNGKKSYTATWLPKCKFTENGETYKTKGDNIEYQTPAITGQATETDEGLWKDVEIFTTEKEAQGWIDEKAGLTEATGSAEEDE